MNLYQENDFGTKGHDVKHVRILGIRGVPAAHGGFETFAEKLSLYLVKHGWKVTVYCQESGEGKLFEDEWKGVNRVTIPVLDDGPKGTMIFDWECIKHAAHSKDLVLTLGYNTAAFCLYLRLLGIPNIVNMDGIEWKRKKWSGAAKIWFYLNDWAGCMIGDHLVADHPEIKKHLATRVNEAKITMIPYGSDRIENASEDALKTYGLTAKTFMTVIARAEPENSILEIVQGFSKKRRNHTLVVLGNYDPANNTYHKKVLDAASDEVKFLGAIYDCRIVKALRFHSSAYVHGHQVGGTNPSLVEALGAGNAIIAHDNHFNRWVTGPTSMFFSNAEEISAVFDDVLQAPERLQKMRVGSLQVHHERFQWDAILSQYENLLEAYLPAVVKPA